MRPRGYHLPPRRGYGLVISLKYCGTKEGLVGLH
jgi:hypothetical protein